MKTPFNATEIKRFFKERYDIKVGVHTVPVKRPFLQLRPIQPSDDFDYDKGVRFSSELRLNALKAIYPSWTEAQYAEIYNKANGDVSYGNIMRYSISFNLQEWERFKLL